MNDCDSWDMFPRTHGVLYIKGKQVLRLDESNKDMLLSPQSAFRASDSHAQSHVICARAFYCKRTCLTITHSHDCAHVL